MRDCDRGEAVGWLEEGQSDSTIVTEVGVSKRVFSRLQKAAEGENSMRKHAGCCGGNTLRGMICTPSGENEL